MSGFCREGWHGIGALKKGRRRFLLKEELLGFRPDRPNPQGGIWTSSSAKNIAC